MANAQHKRLTVLLLGDSIRLGYQPMVAAALADVADVRGPEDNGQDTAYTLAHLDRWIGGQRRAIVHCNCGLHDLKREHGATVLAVPPAAYAENLAALLTCLRAAARAVIFATTTPIDDARHARRGAGFARFNADVVAYNAIARSVCTRLGVPVNDLYATVTSAGGNAMMLPDGTHYTDMGYALLGRAVVDVVRRDLSSLP